jgi:N-acetylglucosamine-6-phosphate deacetylase
MKPCFFDLQVNGFGGVDFQRPELELAAVRHAIDELEQHQTAGILVTLITAPVDALCRQFARWESLRAADARIARMVRGYHLEGPWISREAGYHGAHPLQWAVDARMNDYRRLRDAAGGHLKLITLAPEVAGTIEVIAQARIDGIRVGLGHTNAPDEAIDHAIAAGATLATHLGNAVPAELPRHDNIVQRLLARDELIACLIPDGFHLPPFVLQNFFRAKGVDRVFFTTDAMAAAGAGPGRYTIGPIEVEVAADGVVRLPGDGRFAGSSLTLDVGACNVTRWLGISEDEAIAACAQRPAEHFGISWETTVCTN